MNIQEFWSSIDKHGPVVSKELGRCWLWCRAVNTYGYGVLVLHGKKNRSAHRVAYALTFGPLPPRMHVLHKCDNPACVRPSHLYVGTPKQNTQDMLQRGRCKPARGSKNGHAKLTEQDVLLIRKLWPGTKPCVLARQFDVSSACIVRIIQRKRWQHI